MKTNYLLMTILVTSVVIVPMAFGQDKSDTTQNEILAVTPITTGTTVEDHSYILPLWYKSGYKKAILLHIDEHDDMRPISSHLLEQLRRLKKDLPTNGVLPRFGVDGNQLYDEGSFLRVAFELGIVGKVYWIAPFPCLLNESGLANVRRILIAVGAKAEETDSFVFEEGCFNGTLEGIPLAVCGQNSLPTIKEPVLFSFDADYLIAAAIFFKVSELDALHELFIKLGEKRYQVYGTVFSYSMEHNWVTAERRWVADAALAAMRDPRLMLSKEPPPSWSFLQRASELERLGKYDQIASLGRMHLEMAEDDPPLLYAVAQADLYSGSVNNALTESVKACKVDRGYCYGLLELGDRSLRLGNGNWAKMFYNEAEKLNPGMNYGDIDRSFLMLNIGWKEKAKELLKKLRGTNRSFPYDFVLGDIALADGDREEAARLFQSGLDGLEEAKVVGITHPELIKVLERVVNFYRENGDTATVDRLAHDPLLGLGTTEVK